MVSSYCGTTTAWAGGVRIHIERAAPCQRRGLNLRRRGWDGVRPGSSSPGIVGVVRCSFAFPADASVPRVLDQYTTIREFFADAIGGGKIALFARGLPLFDQFFHLFVADFVFDGPLANDAQQVGVVLADHREDAVEGLQEFLYGFDVARAKRAFFHGDFGFTDEVKDGGEGAAV